MFRNADVMVSTRVLVPSLVLRLGLPGASRGEKPPNDELSIARVNDHVITESNGKEGTG